MKKALITIFLFLFPIYLLTQDTTVIKSKNLNWFYI